MKCPPSLYPFCISSRYIPMRFKRYAGKKEQKEEYGREGQGILMILLWSST